MIGRRGFIGGLLGIISAPAIVKADNLMRVRGIILPREELSDLIYSIYPQKTPLDFYQSDFGIIRPAFYGWETDELRER